jgi:hypothetical protein
LTSLIIKSEKVGKISGVLEIFSNTLTGIEKDEMTELLALPVLAQYTIKMAEHEDCKEYKKW